MTLYNSIIVFFPLYTYSAVTEYYCQKSIVENPWSKCPALIFHNQDGFWLVLCLFSLVPHWYSWTFKEIMTVGAVGLYDENIENDNFAQQEF